MVFSSPINQLSNYNVWQEKLINFLLQFDTWLQEKQLLNNEHKLLIQQIYKHIKLDKINVACIAEFSRGKSELINALFFSNYHTRIIPTSSGRTTMCPTELCYDEKEATCIKLLPIETYIHQAATEDFFTNQNLWTIIDFDMNNENELIEAFQHLKETIWVSEEDATEYGLYHQEDADYHNINEEGLVEISRWRHAIINFPHSLLQQGLVVIDTPGLNAIGSEPELALRLIPEAHVVLFILSADTGVTKTDLELWLSHVQPHQHQSAIVILNKIDTLMDPLKSAEEHQKEILKQMVQTAKYFSISPEQIYPISAKYGFLAKIHQDFEAYRQSGLAALEEVLVTTLIPKRKIILLAKVEHLFIRLIKMTASQIVKDKQEALDQFNQLQTLEQKNASHINYTLKRLTVEKHDFEDLWINCHAMRSSFVKQSSILLSNLDASEIDKYASELREKFLNQQSLSILRDGILELFNDMNKKIIDIEAKIKILANTLYDIANKLNTELGSQILIPKELNLQEYKNTLKEIQDIYNMKFGKFNFFQLDKARLMQRFLDTIISRLRQLMLNLSRDSDIWIKSIIIPIDIELKKQETNLQSKLELIKNVSINPDSIQSNKDKLKIIIQNYDENIMHLTEQEYLLDILLQDIFENNNVPQSIHS